MTEFLHALDCALRLKTQHQIPAYVLPNVCENLFEFLNKSEEILLKLCSKFTKLDNLQKETNRYTMRRITHPSVVFILGYGTKDEDHKILLTDFTMLILGTLPCTNIKST